MKGLKNNLGVALIFLLTAIPVLIWIAMMPLSVRFSSGSLVFRSLGQVSGLVGMALLSINFILSARFKFLDKIFNGLNRVYTKHHWIGGLSFSLLLFHPVFLTTQYLFFSVRSAFDFLFSFNSPDIILGQVGLLVFIGLMIVTFYLSFKYQTWKSTHQYLGIVLLLGGAHMLIIPTDISNNAFLKSYMFILALAGAASYAYRTLLKLYKKKEYKYRLDSVSKINENIWELDLSPVGEKMEWKPGQFIFVRFQVGGLMSEPHPFSISSSSKTGKLKVAIKSLGDYTSKIGELKTGTICNVEGPFGVFSFVNSQNQKQIWVAGGIGITPFLGMARDLALDPEKAKKYNIDLYYSVKNTLEAAFADELEQITLDNPNFKVHLHLSEKEGYISADRIQKESGNVYNEDVFLCGPPAFMGSLREQFINLGIKNNRIHSEEFSIG